jgi:hypothetical protein
MRHRSRVLPTCWTSGFEPLIHTYSWYALRLHQPRRPVMAVCKHTYIPPKIHEQVRIWNRNLVSGSLSLRPAAPHMPRGAKPPVHNQSRQGRQGPTPTGPIPPDSSRSRVTETCIATTKTPHPAPRKSQEPSNQTSPEPSVFDFLSLRNTSSEFRHVKQGQDLSRLYLRKPTIYACPPLPRVSSSICALQQSQQTTPDRDYTM